MGAASLHPGEARVGPGAHSGGVRPRFSLRSQRRARLHGRRLAEIQRLRGGHSHVTHVPPRAKPWSGREPTRMGSYPGSACATEDAPGCMGVARPRPSDAGEGAASPYRAKPGLGREPTWVGSCPDSAFVAEGAPGGKGVAWPKPSGPGEGAASPHRAKPGSGR